MLCTLTLKANLRKDEFHVINLLKEIKHFVQLQLQIKNIYLVTRELTFVLK